MIKREKKLQGPADYIYEKNFKKIPGVYKSDVPTGSLMHETEYLSNQSPASNSYKPDFDRLAQAKRVPRADMNRDKSPKDPLKKLKKDDSPSPSSYTGVDKDWKRMSNF